MFVFYLSSTLIHYAMISINNLSFSYRKNKQIFSDLSFKQPTGSISGLFGKNGAGKSTFLKLLVGLLNPQNGTIEVNGFAPFQRIPDFLTDVFFIPDEDIYIPTSTINNYITATAPFYKKFDYDKMTRIIKEFEIDGESKIGQLSNGQKKKFLVSFALATNCSVLIFDEPTNGLDIPSKSLFRKILAGSIEENQLVLISTHQVKDIENLIDNIIVLKDGEIVLQKTTAQLNDEFVFETGMTQNNDALYCEAVPGGFKSIHKNEGNSDSDLDIEILFNAIISGKINKN